jgi:tRNA (guanine-N(7)-)-methyltransferase subunit TRM82
MPAEDSLPKILVAQDPGSNSPVNSLSLFSLTMNGGRLAVDTTSQVGEDVAESADLEATEQEVRNLLYGMENLRKQKEAEDNGEGGGQAESAEPEAAED